MTFLRFLAIASLVAFIGCGGADTGGGDAAPADDAATTPDDGSAAITPGGEELTMVSFKVSPAMT